MTKLSERPRNRLLNLVLLAIVAWFCSGASCAEIGVPPQSSCVVDQECDAELEICFRGECTASCLTDEDCPNAVCRSEVRAEQDDVVDVCAFADDVNALAMECRFDDDCLQAFPALGARCGIDGSCFIPAFSLLIRDTTTGATVDDGGLGADIAAVYIEDSATGEPIAWADTLALASDVSDGLHAPNGSRVALTADLSCVDAPYTDAATPLGGEGGTLLVQFLEVLTGDTVATPPSSWNVVIVEWGDNCPAGELGEPDSFNVFACAAASHKSTDPDRDCGEFLGSASTGGRLSIAAEQK